MKRLARVGALALIALAFTLPAAADSASNIWRDFEVPGVPASGPHAPLKPDIRAWATDVEGRLRGFDTTYLSSSLVTFGLSQGGISQPTGTMTGYNNGDRITLACTGLTFSTAPVLGVTSTSSGSVTGATVILPGVTNSSIVASAATCSQASTTGSGTGLQITGSLGINAAYVSMASLGTGNSTASNGNLYLNIGPDDAAKMQNAGNENTFIGNKAGVGTKGWSSYTTAVGHSALGDGGSGIVNNGFNSAFGVDAGRNVQGSVSHSVLVGYSAGRNMSGGYNTIVGSLAGSTNGANTPGSLSGYNNVVVGFAAGLALSSGNGNLLLGPKSGSAIATGSGNIILGATNGADNCANGDSSNYFAVCPGAGPVISVTGGGTPSTSVTTIAGSLKTPALATSGGTIKGTLCADTTGAIYVKTTAGACL